MLRETAIETIFGIKRDLLHTVPAEFHPRSWLYWQWFSSPIPKQDHYNTRYKKW